MSRTSTICKKPIKCPNCLKVVTAVPFRGDMCLTPLAAGFYPHGYRCTRCKGSALDIAQPKGAPARLTSEQTEAALAQFPGYKLVAAA